VAYSMPEPRRKSEGFNPDDFYRYLEREEGKQ